MKILHVISSLNPEEGGPVENVRQYCGNYKLKNIKADVLCSDSPKDKWIKKEKKINIYAVGPVKFKYSFNLKLFRWLKLNINNYDCVIINGVWQFHSVAARYVCLKNKIPFYLFTHGMLDPYFSKDIIKYFKQYIYWFLFENKVLRDAHKVIFTTKLEKQLAKISFRPYRCKGITIGYGINRPKSKYFKSNIFLKRYNLKKKKYLLYISRFHKKKGLELLIKSFKNSLLINKDLILVLAGPKNNYFKENIVKIIQENQLENKVLTIGPLYKNLKWQAFKNAYMLCLTSHSENFGIVVAEALSCATPVFITNKVNLHPSITKYKAGFVCKDNFESVNNQLKKIVNLKKNEYKFYSAQAIKCFNDNFEIKKPVLNLLKVINKTK